MIPLDGGTIELCKAIGKRQEEKMRLVYEMIRALKCAELQTNGFMIRPRTRIYHMCSDIIPIAAYLKEQEERTNNPLFNPKFNDSFNQTSPIRIHKEHSSETTDRRPFRRFSVLNGKYTR